MPILTVNAAKIWLKKHGELNERSLAETFTQDFETRWRYNADEGYWLQWVGTHWARQQTHQFLEVLGHYTSQFAHMFRLLGDITHSEAVKLKSQRTVAALEKICRSMPSFLAYSTLFDADPFLLGTPGGTVDLRTGLMRSASPDDYITMITSVTPAKRGTKLGPLFKKFIHDITCDDEDLIKTLQQWFGISAQGTSRDQRILFIYGPGGNGKGVLLRTVAILLGPHAVSAPRDLLMLEKYSQHTTHQVDVLNARMAIATEVDDDATWDTALVKNLTGGDEMTVNRMRQDPFRIIARCSISIAGNRKPALKGIDEAIRRRFLVVTFNFKVEKVIPDLEKLFVSKEGPAILRWIIDGSVQREQEGQLHVAQVIRDDTEDYFAEEDVLGDFINTHLEFTDVNADPVQKERTADVYASWKTYCSGTGRSAGARNTFTTQMQAAGVTYHRANDGRYFLNVRLKLGVEL
jgi:putative DNA primase/helicase